MGRLRVLSASRLMRLFERVMWAFVGLWGLCSLWYPFGWDQGLFAYVGSVIRDGGLPYRDAFEIKGPATYYLFALAQWLFGHNLWGIRVFDLAGLAAAAYLIARTTERYVGPTAGRWAALLQVLWFATLTFWNTAQPDGFVSMLCCFGILPLLRAGDQRRLGHAAWLGLMIGLTALFKPHYAAYLAVPGVYLLIALRNRWGLLLAHLAVMTLVTLSVMALAVAWFYSQGALGDLIENHIAFNAAVYTSGTALAIGPRVKGLLEYILSGEVFVVLLPAVLLGVVRLRRLDPAALGALLTWAGLSLLSVVAQNKFFAYQFAPLFPPLVILAAVGLAGVLGADDQRPADGMGDGRLLGAMLFGVIVFHASLQPAVEIANWATRVAGLRDEHAFRHAFGVPGPDYEVIHYLEEHAEPGDTLVVMGWNAAILYESGLPTVSRHFYSLSLWMGDGSDFQARYRSEFMADLQARPPEFLVVAPQAALLVGREVKLEEFPEFHTFLSERYQRVFEFEGLEVYRPR